ncbi:non-ribosomal peptide synthetase [Variovorax ginsengisoli]|uniref:Amino acid adenylation domain-containing protein n=1 Tax=Variovorax ginsengisoli TaxID=363844 RepID=A0ABT8SD54_9BURK|nr:non-ribosomal peptide synthetase [Variovorax ginsengisoli]MDN8616772.1 amino acid adenylation domain-containing protein [Variovorax ginsengisoli]MDO1535942.1 amino acid adenylation domain-containing protein [Variovorax ginsengisoli]
MNDATMEAPNDEAAEFDPFAGGSIEQIAPTTEAQREIWLADRLAPEASLAYNEAINLRFTGALNTRALATALTRLVDRHDSLRATISPDGTQLLIGEGVPIAMVEHDLGTLDAGAQRQAMKEQAEAVVLAPFSLEHGPLFRAALYRLSPTDHELLLTAHHAICDGWSWGVIVEDLGQLYAAETGAGPTPAPAASFVDYAAREAAETEGPAMQQHVDYWLGRFTGSTLPVLELPLDHPRPAVRTFRSKRADHFLDRELIDALRKIGAASETSLFATMLGAFATLLHRLTEQDDLVIGIPAAGQLANDTPNLVGHCVNLLPLRLAVDTELPFQTLVRQSGTMLLDAFDHRALTYGTLLRKLSVPRDPSRLPLVSVMFNVDRETVAGQGSFPRLGVESSTVVRAYSNFELFLSIAPRPDGMQIETQYNADLFDDATVSRWLAMFEALLRSAASDASQALANLNVLPAVEEAALRTLQPAATPIRGAALMHAGFETQASATPARTALSDGTLNLSYAQLDQESNRLARALRDRGVQRGQHVGLCLNRGADMVVALLAVLKAGATYIPLDPDFPKARLDYYAEDARLSLLLTQSSIATSPRAWCDDAAERIFEIDTDSHWREQSGERLAAGPMDALPDDAAYAIYTSGSTGKPKGVRVPHGAVANFLQSMQVEPSISAADKLAAVTTLSFDIAVLELLLPLQVGAEIVMVPRQTSMDGHALAAFLDQSGATMMQATPGMWRLLVDARWKARGAFRALVGGESLPNDLAHELLRRCGEVWNMYGPTETTVWSTLWHVDGASLADRSVSIGNPIANTTVWIIDSRGKPCPIGVPGEIWIGGKGVTLGYHERPELNSERFVDTRFGGVADRMYRTGDRGRWRNDGRLEHLGRFDFQVKIRGYRIELGEIEARCDEAPGVARSVVLAREDVPGDVRLVAYLAMASDAAYDQATLREHLRSRLPLYMVPQHFVALPALPLLPNGKIDRKALPAPYVVRSTKAVREEPELRVAPRNEREQSVLTAMEEALHLPSMSVLDDFFAMGGHSLLAAHLITRINAAFGTRLPLSKLFEAPTAEQLAREIQRAQGESAAPVAIPVRPDGRSAPLTLDQRRMRFAEDMHPESTTFNTPSAHRLTGALDREKFEQAFRDMVSRQDGLRTAIVPAADGNGWTQQISASIRFDFPFEDLRSIPADRREAEMLRRMQAIVDVPIAAAPAPLFRCALYRLGQDEHVFLFVVHHLVWDGYSFDILDREMAAGYAARLGGSANPLPELSIRYGDYAQWQLEWIEGPEAASQREYWRQRVQQTPVLKAVRHDLQPQPGVPGKGATELVELDAELAERLRLIATQHHLTLNMLLMAAYAVMLSKAVGEAPVSIGMPTRGRMLPDLDQVMGLFVGLVPVHANAEQGLRFLDFAASLKQEIVAALAHQDLPYEHIHQSASPEQRRAGLYQAVFSFQDTRERHRHWGPLAHESVTLEQTGVTDNLGLWLLDRPSGLQGTLAYNASLYKRETAAALCKSFADILAAVAQQPDATLSELCSDVIRPAAAPEASTHSPASILLQPEQARLAQVWASIIGIDVNDIRATDSFFDLGGDSLLAMHAIQQAEQALGFRVEPRRYVFETLGQLAASTAGTPLDAPAVAAATAVQGESRRGLLGRVFSGWGRKG